MDEINARSSLVVVKRLLKTYTRGGCDRKIETRKENLLRWQVREGLVTTGQMPRPGTNKNKPQAGRGKGRQLQGDLEKLPRVPDGRRCDRQRRLGERDTES